MTRAPVLAGLLALGLSAGFAAGEPTKGLVSITFDDASQVQFDHGLRLAQGHGLVGTLFVPAGLVDGAHLPGAWTMGWDEVRAFHAAGWEIGAHGQHHERLPELAPDRVAAEVTEPLAAITREIGEMPVSFSSPFGAFTDATLDRVMESYQAHLSWQGHGGRNRRDAIDPRYIGRLEVVNTMTAAEICGEMVASARDGTWLVLLFHGISEGPPGDYEVSAAMMDEIFSCAAFLQARDVIEVQTVRDALAATRSAP
jgi:peptidoglycan/xylan/chitin deacetylase (PgdA/CDA1 family)